MGTEATTAGQGHTETGAAAATDATKGAAATETGKAETKTETKVETKTETGAATTTTEKGKGATTETKVEGPPEKYSIVVSDKGKVHFDDDDLKSLEAAVRAAGFTNDEAQEYYNEHVAAAEAASARFLEVTKADKDYGGDNLERTQRHVKAGIDLIRPAGHPRRESFLRFLNKVGASNHIEAVSFLADLGSRSGEDTAAGGTGAKNQPKTAEATLYNNTPAAT